MNTIDRERVLAYRVAAQQLHRDAARIADLRVLDIGVQEAMGHPAALAFAARLGDTVDLSPGAIDIGPGHELALAWTLRGAPHIHRRSDLDVLTAALWPLSEPDAAGRLNETGPSVTRAGIPALEQFGLAVAAMHRVVAEPTAKGAASTAVTRLLPEVMRRDCRPCGVRHISDSAMRATSLAAGLEIEPGTAPPVLVPRRAAVRPHEVDLNRLRGLVLGYLDLLGPATPLDVAGYLGARRADVMAAWPEPRDLAEVSVAGRRAWLPAERFDALRAAPEPAVVRLLGPFDPYLQARDRDLVVPDKAVHKTLWPVLGRPGALLVGGEIAGTWRTKASRAMLAVTVEAFAPLPGFVWAAIDSEAQRVARVRDIAGAKVVGR